MGRITSGASRGLDKTAGRNAGSWWWRLLFKPALVAALLLGFLNWLGGEAHAAPGPDKEPRLFCNTTIRWDYSDTYEPAGVDTYELVDWAYSQVKGIADIETKQISSADVHWDWQTPNSGGTFRPGETYRTTTLLGQKYLEHGLNGDREWTRDALREHVLRAVLSDFGVTNPTSTGAGTTSEDRAALARACKRYEAPADNDDDGEGGGLLSGLKPGSIDGAPGVLGGLDTLDLLILVLVVGPLGVFLLAGERLAAVVASKRGSTKGTDLGGLDPV